MQENSSPLGLTAPQAPAPQRVGWSFLLAHPAHFIALGAGAGLAPWAPGTIGTLWAWATFLLLQPHLSAPAWAVLILATTALGWWACTVTARHLQAPDSGQIVIDEIVAFWLVLWLISPAGFWAQLLAFVLFRGFDSLKFGPMRWADQRFKGFGARGGFGILLDDFAAALCTLLVLALWRFGGG
ncbi:phosphatidylglycerophosphatase A [Hydrogenophaga sp.]|uniref:phosphatidylglycerophosphatase A family protein n=1 Tax=Hydrogenophaga sp. TaxID=1904254 RepID=UPI00199D4656|nr:phosphatidylglycerophosphatase A [Hydrogenophaga sp.]MBD3893838.1 phosphatidylglycerophosphatase A [Hydrogenophaga sp.]